MMASRSGFSRWFRDNGLTLFFLVLFSGAIIGQAFTGQADYNHQLLAEHLDPMSFWRYVTSSAFAVDVAENWQSEYLQFWVYIMATVWLVQRGSPESKPLNSSGPESAKGQKIGEHARPDSPRFAKRSEGPGLWLFSNSLCLVMGVFFVLSWLAQAIAGSVNYNEQQLRQLQDPVSWTGYLHTPDFWDRTFQNWQSEFLAIASMVVLSIYLRQRGSSQSKPVGTAHEDTGEEN
jgi:hypothetical protein